MRRPSLLDISRTAISLRRLSKILVFPGPSIQSSRARPGPGPEPWPSRRLQGSGSLMSALYLSPGHGQGSGPGWPRPGPRPWPPKRLEDSGSPMSALNLSPGHGQGQGPPRPDTLTSLQGSARHISMYFSCSEDLTTDRTPCFVQVSRRRQ